jgi:hypothetical protein
MWSTEMKKFPALCFFLFCIVSLSFSQIYNGEATTRNGTVNFTLHYVDYADYLCLLYMDGVSIFIEEKDINHLITILEKFTEWEEMANAEEISLTKTIDSITFKSFYFSHTYFREPVVFYFVFTGGPIEQPGDTSGGETVLTRYTLYVDTTLERIVPFRLSSQTIQEMQDALTPEKLAEARETYENQKALEELFH